MKPDFTIPRDQFDGVVAFLRVAEHRSFRKAAADLGVSPSAVSQAVRGLEQRVGLSLLVRTTRNVGLTEAGARFLASAKPAIAGLDRAFEDLLDHGGEIAGLFRLTVPQAVIKHLIEPHIAEFCALHPKLEVEVFAEDRFTGLIHEGFDAGIRFEESVEGDMVALRLTPPFAFAVVGAPSYFAARGRPRHPRDLAQHACVRFRTADTGEIYRWEFRDNGRPCRMPVKGPLIVNTSELNIAMAASGIALAYAASPLVEEHVAAGRLERVLESYCPSTPGLCLYYPGRSRSSPKLAAFVAFARKRIALPKVPTSSRRPPRPVHRSGS